MLLPVNIAKQLRVVLTAITLLLMVGLNNREVTTYTLVPATKAGHQQVDKSAAADRHGTVKQKISFEATPSYVVLQQAAAVPELSYFSFVKPVLLHFTPQYPAGIVLRYFKTLLSTSIQVNAP
ncbi:hypothetical protein AAE02nite_07740 [Adhaeribacter aerolatus]|uniref:Uncharacterized protein n=1 Tax=Adhaeribacter aerolatus TaxID=670289 RepID=A0A512ATW0_9BACT|nr:hypothetical protein [Adhaeribacter aerolatus]GEO03110.1 hypothetical protein AAE02nite_07740 [Adhaeribacter aerolatus]